MNGSTPVRMLLDLAPVAGRPAGFKYPPEACLAILEAAKKQLDTYNPPCPLPSWASELLAKLQKASPGGDPSLARLQQLRKAMAGQGAPVPGSKYKSRRWNAAAGRWDYDYGDGKGHRTKDHDGPDEAPPGPDIEAVKELGDKATKAKQGLAEALNRLPEGATVKDPEGRTHTKGKEGHWHTGSKGISGAELIEHAAASMARKMGGDEDVARRTHAVMLALFVGLRSFVDGAIPGKNPHWDMDAAALMKISKRILKGEDPDSATQPEPFRTPKTLEEKKEALHATREQIRMAQEERLLDKHLEDAINVLEGLDKKKTEPPEN